MIIYRYTVPMAWYDGVYEDRKAPCKAGRPFTLKHKEGSDKRIIIDYIAGMTDNFSLDCANEILKPEHLNSEIEQSVTGRWFDARR